ncbi:MAG: TetR family transcriptional regulator C-terminal domain-containing protein [Dongiaceae bacterium]
MSTQQAKQQARQQAKGQRKRRHLIEAAIRVVGRKGVARATIQDVAQESDLSVGLANFYFAGKEDLFSAAFQDLAEEYESVWRRRTDGLNDPAAILDAMIIASFDPQILSQAKAAAWFAFWGEACHGDPSFLAIDRIEQRCVGEILRHCRALARQRGLTPTQAKQIGLGLGAMIEGLWSAFALPGGTMQPKMAIRICRDYLAASFDRVPAKLPAGTKTAARNAAPN